ncbi:TM2 domain-containing protein [Caulobacter segnis]|uniref:TM2 domain-containing protein n=1 Tax=Caulobacter segnis TaxID=88688 RepID=UPI0028567BAD|nr:TM2 domain-containing protein [Caulobacter segnis]MDR6627864.1 TM2 domain-containing membrane protein YozV [Caulobacter segnis]
MSEPDVIEVPKPSTQSDAASLTDKKYCLGCGKALHKSAPQCPHCGAPQADVVPAGSKSRVIAIVLALLLGGIGGHKFYLGRVGWGILYLVFCWTFIPSIAALVEAIIYITMSDQAFAKKYG